MIFSSTGTKKEKASFEEEFHFHANYSNNPVKNNQSKQENKFLYYVEEFIFHYILYIKKIEIFIMDSIKKIWDILTSKEAIRVYSIIGQILLFSLILSAIFFLIFGQNNRGTTRRRRRY